MSGIVREHVRGRRVDPRVRRGTWCQLPPFMSMTHILATLLRPRAERSDIEFFLTLTSAARRVLTDF
jgi:hypothetical protein